MQLAIFKYQSPEEQRFNEITTVEIDGEIWFVVLDVCNILGLSNPTEAIRGLDEDEKLNSVLLRAGQKRTVLLVSESGLYALIFKSNKPEAKKFRKWITKEVIPSIRQKGFYGKIDRVEMPNFVLRYQENLHKMEPGYFSVISELFITLHKEFNKYGYEIPDKALDGKQIMPDISVGLTFSNYLTKSESEFAENFKTYEHSFPDGRIERNARMYPFEALGVFRNFVIFLWIPKYAEKYFKKRDPLALDYLPKLLAGNPKPEKKLSGFDKSLKTALNYKPKRSH